MDVSDAEETESPKRSRRSLRTAALAAVAVIVVGIASFTYLHPNFKFGPTASSLQQRPNPVEGRFVTMAFKSPTDGWVVVDDRADKVWVFGTHDAGRHWTAQLSVSTATFTGELQFSDASHGIFYVPGQPVLYLTADAGQHWDHVAVNGLSVQSASFTDPEHGWVVVVDPATLQRVLYRTVDGGKTWTNLGIPVAPGDTMQGVHFSTGTEGWLDAQSSGPYLYATVDGGESWRPLPIAAPSSGWPPGPYKVTAKIVPPTNVVATVTSPSFQPFPGGDATSFSGSPGDLPDIPSAQLPRVLGLVKGRPVPLVGSYQMTMSVDGGSDWFAQNPTFGVAGQADALHWWWTYGRLLFKSSDGGATWTHLQPAYLFLSFDPAMLQVIDDKSAWMSGSIAGHDTLLKTRDGGGIWTQIALPRV